KGSPLAVRLPWCWVPYQLALPVSTGPPGEPAVSAWRPVQPANRASRPSRVSCLTRVAAVRALLTAALLGASALQFLLQQFVDLAGVGLALRRLHGLADEEAEHLGALGFVAGTVLLDLCGIGRQHLVEHGLDGAAVGHLLETLLLDDFVGAGAFRSEEHT